MWPQKELNITSRGENAPDVTLKKKIYQANADDDTEKGYVFNLNFHDTGKVNMVYIPGEEPDQIESSQVPGWLRKEKKKQKQLWGQLKHYCKTTTMYETPFFEPIPEVPRTVLHSESKESESHKQEDPLDKKE